jgi:ribosomal protein S18 acetylase RimI-like enzyme
MHLTTRAVRDERDKARMVALARVQPADNLRLVDLPYRLSSWAFDEPENTRLWETADGDLLAWAVLQTPFWTIDYAYHPAAPPGVHTDILAWADARACAVLDTPYGRPAWFVHVFDWQRQRQRELEAHGFASQANVGQGSWTKVLFQRDVAVPLAYRPLPPGFTLRPLRGVEEVAAYVALHRAAFESENMTVAWRERTLRHPDYRPDLDLVVADSAGELAAFCICWFAPVGVTGRPSGQLEPLGVRADLRREGLARALAAEGLCRLARHGAEHVFVETDGYRDAAFALYEAVGFRVIQDVLVYRQDHAP